MKNVIAVLLLFCSVFQATAQFFVENKKEYKRKYSQARSYMLEEKYDMALPIWFDLNILMKYNANTNFNLGLCYLRSKSQKSSAIPYFEYAAKNVSLKHKDHFKEMTAPIMTYLFLGISYFHNLRFEDAIKAFFVFDSYMKMPEIQNKTDVRKWIETVYNAKRLIRNPLILQVKNLGNKVNSAFPDYCPVPTPDGKKIFFTSRRPCLMDVTNNSTIPNEDIYFSETDEDGNWKEAKPLEKNINSPKHEAVLSISSDGNKIFIYRDDENIYESNFINGFWSEPAVLNPNINSIHRETHAMISKDHQKLFFTSNRPGGYGGLDIWVSVKDSSNNWGTPANLGSTINTPYDEETPYFLEDNNTLYFSSNGHETMGGYDIFTCAMNDNNQWQRPKNIGYPINSTEDDLFFIPANGGESAYFASMKKGGLGEEDIYFYKINKPQNRTVLFYGLVFDSFTARPLNSTIRVFDDQTQEELALIKTSETNGDYSFSVPDNVPLRMEINTEKYFPQIKKISIDELKSSDEINADFKMEKNISDTGVAKLRNQLINSNTIVLNNIYFEFGKTTIKKESYSELEKVVKLLNIEPSIKIEISGHTDNIGKAENNKKISLQRAQAVVDYIKSNGIASERLIFKGYGFENPIAPNDTEEGRSKNRRIEFKVLSK